jgi:hypothetical protein
LKKRQRDNALRSLESGRLENLIRQEEARGVLPVFASDFAPAVASMLKSPQSEDLSVRIDLAAVATFAAPAM